MEKKGIKRRNFLFLLLSGALAFATGGFAALFAKRRSEGKTPQIDTKKAAYWRRIV